MNTSKIVNVGKNDVNLSKPEVELEKSFEKSVSSGACVTLLTMVVLRQMVLSSSQLVAIP